MASFWDIYVKISSWVMGSKNLRNVINFQRSKSQHVYNGISGKNFPRTIHELAWKPGNERSYTMFWLQWAWKHYLNTSHFHNLSRILLWGNPFGKCPYYSHLLQKISITMGSLKPHTRTIPKILMNKPSDGDWLITRYHILLILCLKSHMMCPPFCVLLSTNQTSLKQMST